ncbi:Hypothetical protein HEAR2649 [Herminiimonas arsenicoxydans]|uniref:Uncharacterized protein n=1 Tax=Herminiimonas arsenicoxydans TaxID=204773 RepID=A4G8D4_HERAR|nr:Hypothetical protein HEAR2649 [Herminiimonas arsenicoxydans]
MNLPLIYIALIAYATLAVAFLCYTTL